MRVGECIGAYVYERVNMCVSVCVCVSECVHVRVVGAKEGYA